jgi:HEPN superfamily RiboL-PSP-like protein
LQALTLFNQNFAVAESLLQLYQLFYDLKSSEIGDELRLSICKCWELPEKTHIEHARNDKVQVYAQAAAKIPDSLLMERGLDFLLRQAVIVTCTSLESFFWDALRENVLTIVRARKSGADSMLRDIRVTLGDFISMEQYEDPDDRLRQLILTNFERGTLYGVDSIDDVAKVLTVTSFWDRVGAECEVPQKILKQHIGDLITRRNRIAHRADRPQGSEEADGQGLRPITFAWVNARVQNARTVVTAGAEVISEAIKQLELVIESNEEQRLAQKLAREQES